MCLEQGKTFLHVLEFDWWILCACSPDADPSCARKLLALDPSRFYSFHARALGSWNVSLTNMIPRTRNVWIPKSAWDVKAPANLRVHCQAWMGKGPTKRERDDLPPALLKVWNDAKSESSFRLLCNLLILWLQDEKQKYIYIGFIGC